MGHKNCKVIHQLTSLWLVIYYPYTIGSNSEGSSWHQTPQCVRVFTISTNLYGNALQLHPEATSVHTRVTLEQIVHAPLARATSHTGTLPAHVRTHVPSPGRIPPPKNAPSSGSGLTLHGFRGPSPILRAVVRLRAHARGPSELIRSEAGGAAGGGGALGKRRAGAEDGAGLGAETAGSQATGSQAVDAMGAGEDAGEAEEEEESSGGVVIERRSGPLRV